MSLQSHDNLGNTPLHLAILDGRTEFSLIIVALTDEVNATGEDDNTALHLACIKGEYRVARRLIAFDASFNIKNSHQKTSKDLASNDLKHLVPFI